MVDGAKGAIPEVVLGTLGQLNLLLGAGLTIVATYKAARAAWKAAHPSADSPFLEDAQLIDMLEKDADGLVAHADAITRKYSAVPAEAGDPTGGA